MDVLKKLVTNKDLFSLQKLTAYSYALLPVFILIMEPSKDFLS